MKPTKETNMNGIEGRLFVVTGGAKGIGEATVQRLVKERARVVICDIDPNGESLAATLRESGADVQFRKINLTDNIAIEELVRDIVSTLGAVDGLVNNAGIALPHAAVDCTEEIWDRTINLNLKAVFFCCQAFGKHMISVGKGSIVNIGSIAGSGVVRPERHVAYGITKAAVAHMTHLLAVEWGGHNLRVNAVAPGYTQTPLLKEIEDADPSMVATWREDTPMNRLMLPLEIASSITFLLSDDASGITGHVLATDGGYAAH
jgi:NAD(P)-dependent dehydrogenase (short-subunit alcohol dehydrogenase family)